MDNIVRIEEDYDLPKGVKSRRDDKYNLSYYWASDVNPDNIDQHLDYAQKSGFRTFVIYYRAFSKTPGHFEWRETYPNGIEVLQNVVNKIKDAGMVPGFHIHCSKAGKGDKYVTPKPDHRLNVRNHFTLSEPLGKNDTTIFE